MFEDMTGELTAQGGWPTLTRLLEFVGDEFLANARNVL
jgi:hypothetical protein